MVPAQLDLVVRRLILFGAPKDAKLNRKMVFVFTSMLIRNLGLINWILHPSTCTLAIKAFVLIVLLLSWQSFFDLSSSAEYQVIEYYAGVGRIARLSASYGLKAAAYDIAYDKPDITQQWHGSPTSRAKVGNLQSKKQYAMDLTTSAGFSLLGFFSRLMDFLR